MIPPRVLFLDDEALEPHHEWEKVLVEPLRAAGLDVVPEADPTALAARLDEGFAAVLLDLRFGREEGLGLRLLRQIKTSPRPEPVVVLTARSGVAIDLECHAAGADGYQDKGNLDAETLAEMLQLLIHEVPGSTLLLGRSSPARDLRRAVRLARSCDATVLITGETGTGKELVARGAHLLGPRWSSEAGFGNFVAVNCAGVPDDLWESEMFGHRRGAATGLSSTHAGSFLAAAGYRVAGEPRRDADPVPLARSGLPGTLFLDELGELPPAMQAKLLRAVQERRLRLVGDPREYPSDDRLDVRLVAATNRDLREEVGSGRFRADLYYRLNVLPLRVPPLRERLDDIPTLLCAFVKRHAGRGPSVRNVTPDALELLQRHPWPGNVRELENAAERALARLRFEGGTVLEARHFDLDPPAGPPQTDALARRLAEALLAGEVEPGAINPRPPAGGSPTFGTLVYRLVAEILRDRGELSQRRLAEVWGTEPGSIGPLNSACGVQVRRRAES
jgi:two-component system response regulator HydG